MVKSVKSMKLPSRQNRKSKPYKRTEIYDDGSATKMYKKAIEGKTSDATLNENSGYLDVLKLD